MIIAFFFWALEHNSFEGFENTNPRGQLGGERFHLSYSKLGLEDAILHPHHSTSATGTIFYSGRNLEGFQQRGRTTDWRKIRSRSLRRLLEI
jgi:hypothetical protein